MIDRFGNPIYVGWDEITDNWIDAALTLPKEYRTAAYIDIAYMSGRTFDAVQQRAWKRRTDKNAKARMTIAKWLSEHNRLSYDTAPAKPVQPNFHIAAPTKADLMARRAWPRKSTPAKPDLDASI